MINSVKVCMWSVYGLESLSPYKSITARSRVRVTGIEYKNTFIFTSHHIAEDTGIACRVGSIVIYPFTIVQQCESVPLCINRIENGRPRQN